MNSSDRSRYIGLGANTKNTHPAFLLIDVAAQVLDAPGQPEVGDLTHFVVVDEDVARSQVSVDDLRRNAEGKNDY